MPIDGEIRVRHRKRVMAPDGVRGKHKRLSDRERVFVDAYVDRGSDTFLKQKKAYELAYRPGEDVRDASIRSMASRALARPHVREAILNELAVAGIDPAYQARKLKQLMESTKKVYHNGMEIDEIPDNETQLKALNASFKITEVIQKMHEDVEGGIHIKMSEETAQRLMGIAEEMRRMREGMCKTPTK